MTSLLLRYHVSQLYFVCNHFILLCEGFQCWPKLNCVCNFVVAQQTIFTVPAPVQQGTSSNKTGNASVLMNLLCNGHDDKYGYNVPRKMMEQQV